MSEFIKINWPLIASVLIWVIGLGVLVAAVTLGRFFKRRISEKQVLAGVLCLVLGGVLFLFRLPSPRLIFPALTTVDTEKCMTLDAPGSTKKVFQVEELNIDYKNRGHKRNTTEIIDNTAAMFYNGFVKTPFIAFRGGEYQLNFQARGTRVGDEYAILGVEFEAVDPDLNILTIHQRYFPLTGVMKPYKMIFQAQKGTVGRLKVSFVNDHLLPGLTQDRNAWVKDLTIWKTK